MEWLRSRRVALGVLAAGLVALGASVPLWGRDGGSAVAVGAGGGTEQQVLAQLAVTALRDAGIDADAVDVGGDTRRLRGDLTRGEIDLYWDYTGAAWSLALGQQAPEVDPHESFARVADQDRDAGLVWLGPSRANATLALFVRAREVAEADRTLSWLAARLSEGRRLCADEAFVEREGGLPSLAAAYGIGEQAQVVTAAEDAAVRQVASGECFAGLATATSGLARSLDLVPVADDLTVFPAFVIAPVAEEATLARVPGLDRALQPLLARLTTEELAALNALAERDDTDPAALARAFLDGG